MTAEGDAPDFTIGIVEVSTGRRDERPRDTTQTTLAELDGPKPEAPRSVRREFDR